MAEAFAALGVISSIISIATAVKQVYDAAQNNRDFPQAFKDVATRLPVVIDLLNEANLYIKGSELDSNEGKMVINLVNSSKEKVEKLEILFRILAPEQGESRFKRYQRAARQIGKGGRVEDLFGGILKDVEVLMTWFNFPNSTARAKKASAELDDEYKKKPSLPDGDLESGFQPLNAHFGSGSQVNNTLTGSGIQSNHNYGGNGHTIYHGPSSNDVADDVVENLILDDLGFPTMKKRFEDVKSAHKETFGWIFKERLDQFTQGEDHFTDKQHHNIRPTWSDFSKWLSEDCGLYWINGKAGSGKDQTNFGLGKSTLMKFIVDNPRTTDLLNQWSRGEGHIIGTHFFWKIGTEDEHSQLGLLRSLLYDILSRKRPLIPKVLPEEWERCTRECKIASRLRTDGTLTRGWALHRVQRALDNAIPSCGNLCLFIDGLDEYSGDSLETALYLRRLTSSNFNVKICVSSRPEEIFKELFREQPMLRLQDLTGPDISHYVSSELQKSSLIRGLNFSGVSGLCKDIVEKAQGVFLWVTLVVRSLLEGLVNADRIQDLRRRLKAMPSELSEMYQYMINSIDEQYRHESSQIFRFISCNLRKSEPHCALAVSFFLDFLGSQPSPPIGYLNDLAIINRVHIVEKRLQVCCKGLLEFAQYSRLQSGDAALFSHLGNRRILYIHRTAAEFVQSKFDSQLLPNGWKIRDMHHSLLTSQMWWLEALIPSLCCLQLNVETLPQIYWPCYRALAKIMSISCEVQETLSPTDINAQLNSLFKVMEIANRRTLCFYYDSHDFGSYWKQDVLSISILWGHHVYLEANLTREKVARKEGIPYLAQIAACIREWNAEPKATLPCLLKVIPILFKCGCKPNQNIFHRSSAGDTQDFFAPRTVWTELLFELNELSGATNYGRPVEWHLVADMVSEFILNGACCKAKKVWLRLDEVELGTPDPRDYLHLTIEEAIKYIFRDHEESLSLIKERTGSLWPGNVAAKKRKHQPEQSGDAEPKRKIVLRSKWE